MVSSLLVIACRVEGCRACRVWDLESSMVEEGLCYRGMVGI